MNDSQIYKMQQELREAESYLKLAYKHLTFTWQENPTYPLEVSKMCALATGLLIAVGIAAGKEVNTEACANHPVIDEDKSPNS